MRTNIDLDEFLPTMDAPEKVYQLFESLGFKVLDSHLKTNPSVYNLPAKEAALVENIYAVSNYDRRFQILMFKLREENREAIRTIPEKILREVDFPFIIFTPDFKTYTFTLVEKVREGPGEFKRKLTKLIVDSSQPYHTDKEIISSLALSTDIKNPVEVYKLFQSAFNVERVTKKFFTEYRDVFEKLSKEITKQNKHLKFTLFSREGSVENFTKILLGRLMFLYFIQKRGWLNCFDGWGSGDKKFLYNKFQEAKKEKKNYFKDYLEPLFFDTLNNPRRDKPDQATQFGGRIPFLNGGLFEPEYDYTDLRNHILLENSTFDEVFSVFEKYNFTVKEDEPLEKEVAIDPEMLGKVFENLLEENLRKGKGTYYTPREIVHYMCHESLINYLASEVNLDQDVVRIFLDREQSFEKKETLNSLIRENAKEIDNKLENIKVLDPACGSGAFLVGMLHEVINVRLSLNRELGRSLSEYELKKATIQNNIYGVDIDPGASEIAKLRLWLTLVVDHNLSEIEPLPNLDYKIMVGNSLLDEFMGVKLFDLEKVREKTSQKKMLNLFEEDSQLDLLESQTKKSSILSELQKLHQVYFKESDSLNKKQIRTQIDKIEFDLIETTVKDEVSKLEDQTKFIAEKYLMQGLGIPQKEAERIAKISSQQAQILETFNEIKKSNVKPFFLFQLHFSDVFERKGGFDVVIANPPYISFQEIEKESKSAYKKFYDSAKGKYDIYLLFIEKALKLAKNEGHICYIVPNKFIRSNYGEGIKNVILRHQILEIMDFNDIQVFDNVTNYTCILLLEKTEISSPKDFKYRNVNKIQESNFFYDLHNVEQRKMSSGNWFLGSDVENKILEKMKQGNKTLKDISLTITQGLRTGQLKIFYENINSEFIKLNRIEKELIKPVYHGKNIKKYKSTLKEASDIILFPYETDCKTPISIDDYPNTKKYLERYKNELLNRKDSGKVFKNTNKLWFEYWDSKPICFSSPKIIFPDISNCNQFFLDTKKIGYLNTCYAIFLKNVEDYKPILAILNSKLAEFFIKKISPSVRGGFYRYKTNYLKQLPIPNIEQQNIKGLTQYVNEISSISLDKNLQSSKTLQTQVQKYEEQIDYLVYKLYGLTPEEIAIVEGIVLPSRG